MLPYRRLVSIHQSDSNEIGIKGLKGPHRNETEINISHLKSAIRNALEIPQQSSSGNSGL